MAIDDKMKDKKLIHDINSEAAKYQPYHLVKLINMNILQVKNLHKMNLHILL